MEQALLYEDDNFQISGYPKECSSALVVFISAGRGGNWENGYVEEFLGTLSGLDTGIFFVNDTKNFWYNHKTTEVMFSNLQKILVRYSKIGVLGQSMGGSGSILSTNYLNKIERVLAFVPQYSIKIPYILFDENIRIHSECRIPDHYFDHYAACPIVEKCHIIYGNCEWQDYIQRSMFELYNFRIFTVNGAKHNVAQFLKQVPGNLLKQLLTEFSNFETVFDHNVIAEILGSFSVSLKMDPSQRHLPPFHRKS